MPRRLENTGSTSRDFNMLERNFLSHLKLTLLLTLLSASLLLQARLVPQDQRSTKQWNRVPLASVEFASAVLCLIAGVCEYWQGYRDLVYARPFWTGVKFHTMFLTPVALAIFATCITSLVYD
ncbi:hypothetical protein NMY22_g19590 [Coprinellus aureogranulatus]|nr:hypothetical protein NMY22_g19590 [Coprinellus aureogranulatus]